ncbi:HPr(Ser) kinase/phosphatase [Elongatibacter sediminis]|uniref:HPr(Ser) kinase/phosphatase n=1 Tax=Elongatibacter sediminis TaxID=3119006 RepID=A0AAW9RL97_9GAMM
MTRSLTALELFGDLEERLALKWVGEPAGEDWPGVASRDLSVRPALAGFLNVIHPNAVQVLGVEELTFIDDLDEVGRKRTANLVMRADPLAIIVGDGHPMPEIIVNRVADHPCVALMRSNLPAYELVNYLQHYMSRCLAKRTTLHGVFMEVFTIGVHLMGDSGCGKSELALELLTRGHRLIADDAPEFTQISPDIIDGTCPPALQDCLEVRGLGVLNVRQMFGDATIKLNKFLRLIINLEIPDNPQQPASKDRLRGDTAMVRVLDLDIPSITLQVRAGRNLAVMVEAAVRDFMLRMKGIDASAAFIERHARLLQQDNGGWSD